MKTSKFFAVLLLLVFLLSSCSKDMPKTISAKSDTGELKNHIGEYVMGKLISLPRVALVADEYAIKETDIPSEELLITEAGVIFRDELFTCIETQKCDLKSMSEHFNVGGEYAVNLCGYDEEVTVFTLRDNNGNVICLILGENDKLKLWVTEPFLYIGGYEVLPEGFGTDITNTTEIDVSGIQSREFPEFVYDDITYESYKNGSVTIKYPQFSDSSKADVNELIKSEATRIFYEGYAADATNLTLEISCGITFKNEYLLSVVFYGYGDRYGAAHPNRHFYTLNIDLKNVKKIHLGDVYTDFDEFCSIIRKQNFVFAMYDDPEHTETYSVNELFPFDKLEFCDKPQSEMYSYFTENHLGISFSVPHAIGDHKEIEILYNEIEILYNAIGDIAIGLDWIR